MNTTLALALVLTGPSPPLAPLKLPGAPPLPFETTMALKVGLSGAKGEGYLAGLGGDGSIKVKAGLVSREVDAVLTEVDIAEVVRFLDLGLPAFVSQNLRGKVGLVTITVRGDEAVILATGFRMFCGQGCIRSVEARMNLKTRDVNVTAEAFGGRIGVRMKMPEERK